MTASSTLTVDGATTNRDARPPARPVPRPGVRLLGRKLRPAARHRTDGEALILKSIALDTFNIGTPGANILAGFYLAADRCQRLLMDVDPPGVGLIRPAVRAQYWASPRGSGW